MKSLSSIVWCGTGAVFLLRSPFPRSSWKKTDHQTGILLARNVMSNSSEKKKFYQSIRCIPILFPDPRSIKTCVGILSLLVWFKIDKRRILPKSKHKVRIKRTPGDSMVFAVGQPQIACILTCILTFVILWKKQVKKHWWSLIDSDW